MTTTDAGRALPFWKAAQITLRLSLRGLLRNRRSAVLALLLGLPVLIALVQRLAAPGSAASANLYTILVAGYYVGSFLPFVGKAVPLAALFFAAALISDEVEGRTLVYYLTRPIPRAAGVIGKWGAALAWTAGATAASLLLVFALTAPDLATALASAPRLLRDVAVTFAALTAYGALFAALGALLRRPLVPGILFLYLWEWLARITPATARLTLSTPIESLLSRDTLPARLNWLIGRTALPPAEAIAIIVAVTLAGVGLASYVFARREHTPHR